MTLMGGQVTSTMVSEALGGCCEAARSLPGGHAWFDRGDELARLGFERVPEQHRELLEGVVGVLERPGEGLLLHDRRGEILYVNFRVREIMGVDWPQESSALPEGWAYVDADGVELAPEDLPRSQALRDGVARHAERFGVRSPDGDTRWMVADAHPISLADGAVAYVVTTVADATAHVDRPVDEPAPSAIVAIDDQGRVTFVNHVAETMYGCSATTAVGRPATEVLTWDLPAHRIEQLARLGPGAPPWSGELWVRHRDGTCAPVNVTITGFVDAEGRPAAVTVTTSALAAAAAVDAAPEPAVLDALTGLGNRRMLFESLRRTFRSHDLRQGSVVVVVLDLDDLRVVNDGFGRITGDRLLCDTAEALRAEVHPTDVVARLEGGTFAVCCTHLGLHADAGAYAERLRAAVSASVAVGDYRLGCSAGVAASRSADDDPDEVLQRADMALARAKELGKQRTSVYDDALRRRLRRELELERILRTHLAAETITLGYQPVVHLGDERVCGAEALLRLVDEEGERVSAQELVDVAERRGLIGELGRQVLAVACAQAARWQAERPDRVLGVAVNVSVRQLEDGALPAEVARILDATGLDPSRLTLEITESALMEDSERSASLLAQLKMLGVRLAADDFGTGYSSLAYLKRFPLDVVKADLSFVAGLPASQEDAAVVRAMVGMARALSLDVIAEGVESERQVIALRELGCELAQGWHWSPCVAGDEFLRCIDDLERLRPRTRSTALVEACVPAAPTSMADPALGIALASLAHEIRDPLTVITACASGMGTGPWDASLGSSAILDAAVQIEHLLHHLDDLQAVDGGRLDLEAEVIDLATLAERAVAMAAGSTAPTHVERLLVGPAYVLGDTRRLREVLGHLLSNARRFSPPGATVLVLVARRARWVEVTVHDEGPGVPDDQVEVAFRKFGRLDDRRAGMGIGLYLARGIARAHGGDLVYRPRSDRPGAAFTLRLPVAPAQAAPVRPPG